MLKLRLPYHSGIFCLTSLSFVTGCTDITDLKITIAETVKVNTTTEVTIIKSGEGSGEWNLGDKDGFNYYFTSVPAEKFLVEEVKGKENDYCRTSESNQVTDGVLRNEVHRDMLIKEKSPGEITIAIACHKKMFRLSSTDSVLNIEMVVEDNDDHVLDTVNFKILR